MKDKQIGFRASENEHRRFVKAASKIKTIDGKLTISAFLRVAANKLADEVIEGSYAPKI